MIYSIDRYRLAASLTIEHQELNNEECSHVPDLRFFCAILLGSCAAQAQQNSSLKQRCEEIVVNSLRDSIKKAEASVKAGAKPESHFASQLWRAKLVPIEQVEDILLTGLNSTDIEVRSVSAQVLVQNAPMQFEDAIRESLGPPLELRSSMDRVRRAAIFMKMGDDRAEQELHHWAGHQFNKLELGDWICPMMCVKPSKKSGECTICGMKMVEKSRFPDQNDWQARLFALRTLQAEGGKVAEVARAVVVSDAPAYVRQEAAALWAKEDPEDATPHLEIFLHSESPYIAVELLAALAPGKFVAKFEHFIDAGKADDESTVLAAHRGLLRAGETKHLATIRKWVDQPANSDDEEFKKVEGIYLLGELGLAEDVTRLKKQLDTKFKVVAAETLLKVFARGIQKK